jgi:selenium metabolism protein YedF
MRTVDTSGMKCPQPIIETKRALKESSENEVIQVIIDNKTSLRNVRRFLSDNKISFSDSGAGDKWVLTLNSEKGSVATSAAEDYCETELPTGKGYSVAVTSDIMGSGDDELGKRLMRSFFVSLSCMDNPPSFMAFYNYGVRLLAEDSEIISIVQELELKGTEVMVCGTCTDHYGLGGRIKAGITGDMLSIVTKLTASGNIIRP